MPGYSKFRNHMEEPESMISEKNKDLIANASMVGLIGIAALTAGPAMAALGGALWATDRVRRNS